MSAPLPGPAPRASCPSRDTRPAARASDWVIGLLCGTAAVLLMPLLLAAVAELIWGVADQGPGFLGMIVGIYGAPLWMAGTCWIVVARRRRGRRGGARGDDA